MKTFYECLLRAHKESINFKKKKIKSLKNELQELYL